MEKPVTAFSQYLQAHQIKPPDLAKSLDISPSYAYMIVRGAVQPGWKLARKIEAWSTEAFGAEQAFTLALWS